MYVFIVGIERSGTHSLINIIKNACKVPHSVVHEEPPFLCQEAKLLFEGQDFRTKTLKSKVQSWRQKHKECKLVCEANHRFGYLITFLMKEFGPDCKFIFSIRDPVDTIISRICIWSYYPNFINKYPDFYKKKISEIPAHDFNTYRISPPPSFNDKSLVELYLWEWLENYKFVRSELACIPKQNRHIIFTEDITKQFDRILKFVGLEYVRVDEDVRGWARVKSDSIYTQPKETPTDVFVTRNRNPLTDETVIFARKEMDRCKDLVAAEVITEFSRLQLDIDEDLVQMDKRLCGETPLKALSIDIRGILR